MPSRLRPIAVYVEEPEPGAFLWVLIEKERGHTWSEIDRSDRSARTYRQAMADGLLALQAMAEDLVTGPRRPAAGHGAAADTAAAEPDEAEPPPPPARPSLFGFGPAR